MDSSESQIDPPNAWTTMKTHIFRLLAALLEGLLELLGGVGPWTFPNVQSTLQEGVVDLGPLRKSNRPSGTLWEGGWTLDFTKERIQLQRGGGYKVTLVLWHA